MYNFKNIDPSTIGDWILNTDDADNYTYVRCIFHAATYEVAHARRDGDNAEFIHTMVFIGDYDFRELDKIVSGFGYQSFAAYASEQTDDGIDFYPALAAMIAESMDGRNMSYKFAAQLTDEIVNGLNDKVDEAPAKHEISYERAVELLNEVVDHVVAGENTSGQIEELSSMGFTEDDLLAFGYTQEDIDNYNSGCDDDDDEE